MPRIRVWDLPTRLFHWALAVGVVAAFVSAKLGAMDMHAAVGLALLGLLVFRVAWGFCGGTHARFVNFLRGPAAIRDYLQGRWQGVGHNPLGALSVLAFLAALLLQAGTGLFAHDDATFTGPLASLVSADLGDALSRVHRLQEVLILGLVALHVAAILYYRFAKQQDLVTPMITGEKETDGTQAIETPVRGGVVALLCSLALAGATVYAASGAWLPPPPPPEPLPAAMDW